MAIENGGGRNRRSSISDREGTRRVPTTEAMRLKLASAAAEIMYSTVGLRHLRRRLLLRFSPRRNLFPKRIRYVVFHILEAIAVGEGRSHAPRGQRVPPPHAEIRRVVHVAVRVERSPCETTRFGGNKPMKYI